MTYSTLPDVGAREMRMQLDKDEKQCWQVLLLAQVRHISIQS